MTITQQIITLALCALATMATRFLPFLVFRENRETPAFIKYIGKYLPSAVFGMLVIYCLKDIDLGSRPHGLPELISIAITAGFHIWKRQMLISIAVGTIAYMALIKIM